MRKPSILYSYYSENDFKSGDSTYRPYLKLSQPGKGEITVRYNKFSVDNNTFSEGSGESDFPVGCAVAKTCQVELYNEDNFLNDFDLSKCSFTMSIQAYSNDQSKSNDYIGTVEFGTYYVQSYKQKRDKVIITGIDSVAKLDKEFETKLTYPKTAYDLLYAVVVECGLALSLSTQTTNELKSIVITSVPDSSLRCRALAGYIAGMVGGNIVIANGTVARTVTIKQYSDILNSQFFDLPIGGSFNDYGLHSPETKNADGGSFYPWNAETSVNGGSSFNPGYQIFTQWKDIEADFGTVTVTGITHAYQQNDSTVYAKAGEEGYLLQFENPLVDAENVQRVLEISSKYLVGLTLTPFSGEHTPNYLAEFMDEIVVVDGDNVYPSFISDMSYSLNGMMHIKNVAQSEAENQQEFVNPNESVRLVIGRKLEGYDKYIKEFNDLMANSLGVYTTVVKQPDGSSLIYMHDAPALTGSSKIWRQSADGFSVSGDGGKTWTAGFGSDGKAVFNILSAIGINFDWAHGGTLTLGGSNNQSGWMEVYDANKKKMVQLDKDGLSMFNTNSVKMIAITLAGMVLNNTSGNKIVQLSTGGFELYTASGTRILSLDNNGLTLYTSGGVRILSVNNSGFILYNASGTTILSLTNAGLRLNDSSGIKTIDLTNSGLRMFDQDGAVISVFDKNGIALNDNGVITSKMMTIVKDGDDPTELYRMRMSSGTITFTSNSWSYYNTFTIRAFDDYYTSELDTRPSGTQVPVYTRHQEGGFIIKEAQQIALFASPVDYEGASNPNKYNQAKVFSVNNKGHGRFLGSIYAEGGFTGSAANVTNGYFRTGQYAGISFSELSAGGGRWHSRITADSDGITFRPMDGLDGNSTNKMVHIKGGLKVEGTDKNRIIETEHYGKVAINAVESPVPSFQDFGSATIAEDGIVYVFIDPEFYETIEDFAEYHVMITRTSEKQTEWVDKHNGYFIVHGEAGATFDWMVNAPQKGLSMTRLEKEPYKEEKPMIYFDDSIFETDNDCIKELNRALSEELKAINLLGGIYND